MTRPRAAIFATIRTAGAIYILAKRWEYPVGRPEIQKFAGALQGKPRGGWWAKETSRVRCGARGSSRGPGRNDHIPRKVSDPSVKTDLLKLPRMEKGRRR